MFLTFERRRAPAPRIAWVAAALGLFLVFLAGCGMAPTERVVTSANAYAYYFARYQEACVDAVGPSSCGVEYAALLRWRGRLGEAQAALVTAAKGGKLPLQLEELRRVEKETRACRRR